MLAPLIVPKVLVDEDVDGDVVLSGSPPVRVMVEDPIVSVVRLGVDAAEPAITVSASVVVLSPNVTVR